MLLPEYGNNVETSSHRCDKYLMNAAAKNAGLAVCEQLLITSSGLHKEQKGMIEKMLPVFIKPTSGAASYNVISAIVLKRSKGILTRMLRNNTFYQKKVKHLLFRKLLRVRNIL
jgi:D-alanine-D-alanine ligase-like ATP-grasp enzyme